MTNFEQCLLSDKNIKYWQPISAVADSLGIFFTDCSRKVFHFEPFCNDDKNLRNVFRVDAIAIKKRNLIKTEINFLEFKGGKTIEKWDKNCFALKAFDTLHCGLSNLVCNDRRAWSNLFSDEGLVFNFYIIISDEHVIASLETTDEQVITGRDTQQKGKEELGCLQGQLHRYEDKHPFDFVKVIPTCSFLEKIDKIVDDIQV